MKPQNLVIPGIVGLLVVLSGLLGLLVPDFYSTRRNTISSFEIMGQDGVSVLVGLAVLFWSFPRRKFPSDSGVLLGLLVYCAYTYSYFSFGLLFSKIYIVSLAIASLSWFSLGSLVISAVKRDTLVTGSYLRKTTSVYMLVVVAIVGAIDLKDVLLATVLGPSGFDSKRVFYVLDLAFLFPSMVLAAWVNLQRRSLGVVLMTAFLVKTVALMPALLLSDLLHYLALGSFVDFGFDVIALAIAISAVTMLVLWRMSTKNIPVSTS